MKQIIFRESDIPLICKGKKIKTCRDVTNYLFFKKGQMVEFKANYGHCGFANAFVEDVEIIEDITKQKAEFYKELGYQSKKQYLAEPFNKGNQDKARCVITFSVFAISLNDYYFKYLIEAKERRDNAKH